METKGIDLTKCKGWNFKAKIHGTQCEGRIQVERGAVYLCQDRMDGSECQDTWGFKYSWGILNGSEGALKTNNVTDLEIVPRDPETYKDWQVGDKVCEDEHEDACLEVIFRSGELVVCKNADGDIDGGYTCEQLYRLGYRLVLTDIERQIIEEKKEYKPQDGDICFVKTSAGNRFVFIIKRDDEPGEEIHGYIIMATNSKSLYSSSVPCVCKRKSIRELRPATDEEKQMLFDALEKKGKRWNAKKKVVEDIPKTDEFKARDVVMVRDAKERWKLMTFVAMGSGAYKYEVTNGEKFSAYKHCIPYNEKTMHLLGTGEDYKEE